MARRLSRDKRPALPEEYPRDRCGEPPTPELLLAVKQFNTREYFECHETLEAIWLREPEVVRTLYKGVLQVGVGCFHLLRDNYRGASVKLQSGRAYLEPFAPECMGINVGKLIDDTTTLLAAVVACGSHGTQQVDRMLLPTIELNPHTDSEESDPGGMTGK